MNNRKVLITVVAAVAILVVILVAASLKKSGTGLNYRPGGTPAAPKAPVIRESAPANIVVPEKGASVPANVAPPQVVAPGNPTNSTSFRSFELSLNKGAYTPNTVIVKFGDTTHINITAIDKDYDLAQSDFGYKNIPLLKGKSYPLEFQASATGKFTFYCGACGGPTSGPVFYLIIAPK